MFRHYSDIPDFTQIIQKLQQQVAVRAFCSKACFNYRYLMLIIEGHAVISVAKLKGQQEG